MKIWIFTGKKFHLCGHKESVTVFAKDLEGAKNIFLVWYQKNNHSHYIHALDKNTNDKNLFESFSVSCVELTGNDESVICGTE